MNEVVAMQTQPLQVAQAEAPAPVNMLEVISRAAANPAVDVDKMERLMLMQERLLAKQAEAAFNADLALMQPELPVISHRGEILNKAGQVASTYALWEDINDAIRPILAKHGFALTFKVGQEGTNRVVTAFLRHREGHKEETTLALPLDTSGFKNDVQAVGSSLSYAKRYTAMALLNITTTGEDDDGQRAGADFISADQKDELIALIKETNSDTAKFLQFIRANSLDEIKARDFNKARDKLLEKRSRK
jgi:hypothetical protein